MTFWFSLLVSLSALGATCSSLEAPLSERLLTWLRWEINGNHPKFTKPLQLRLRWSLVSAERLQTPMGLHPISALFRSQGHWLWPQHEWNQDDSVPFRKKLIPLESDAWTTASRSVVIRFEDKVYSIKMPTDHPHGPGGEREPEKISLHLDVRMAPLRQALIKEVDQKLGPDPDLRILPEVFVLKDRRSKNGIIVRDISSLDDGFLYLPVFAIPTVGKQIAEQAGVPFDVFWGKHFAEALGRAKAKLALRYGLQFDLPNSQNFLVQLDSAMRPTGVIVLRDISDTRHVKHLSMALDLHKNLSVDAHMNDAVDEVLDPKWWVSVGLFGDLGVPRTTLEKWEELHDRAYIHEFELSLEKSFEPAWWRPRLGILGKSSRMQLLNDFLKSNNSKIVFVKR